MYKNNSGLIAKTKQSKHKKAVFNRKVSECKSATILIRDPFLTPKPPPPNALSEPFYSILPIEVLCFWVVVFVLGEL